MKPTCGPRFPPWRPGADPDALSRVGIAKGTMETVRNVAERQGMVTRERYDRVVMFAILGWSAFAGSALARLLEMLR